MAIDNDESFEEWFKRVKILLAGYGWPQSTIDELDAEAWREYYDEDLTTAQAISEELGSEE